MITTYEYYTKYNFVAPLTDRLNKVRTKLKIKSFDMKLNSKHRTEDKKLKTKEEKHEKPKHRKIKNLVLPGRKC